MKISHDGERCFHVADDLQAVPFSTDISDDRLHALIDDLLSWEAHADCSSAAASAAGCLSLQHSRDRRAGRHRLPDARRAGGPDRRRRAGRVRHGAGGVGCGQPLDRAAGTALLYTAGTGAGRECVHAVGRQQPAADRDVRRGGRIGSHEDRRRRTER